MVDTTATQASVRLSPMPRVSIQQVAASHSTSCAFISTTLFTGVVLGWGVTVTGPTPQHGVSVTVGVALGVGVCVPYSAVFCTLVSLCTKAVTLAASWVLLAAIVP